jgi:UDP-glucose 4-epimerase
VKILVTGGAGFIGSHIVDALVELGHEVAVVDNLATGFERNINPRARFYRLSISDRELAEVFERERPQIVNHQAAQTVVTRSVAEPIFDAEQNILGSLNVILNCLKFGVDKIVYASSGGAVYGEPEYRPVDESHPVNALSQYGISKHTVEHYLQLYNMEHGLNYAVLRYANVYGPRQNPQGEAGVVAIFAGKMLRGEQPTIFGQGDKTRDYISVGDVVAANILAMQSGRNEIYNIGTGIETSDQEMFDALAELLGYKGAPHYAPMRKGEVLRICLDCSRAERELGWQPRLSLREGLSRAIDYYRNIYL